MKNFNIKKMKLYKSTNRFIIEYNNLEKNLNRQATIDELSVFDHMHYNGKHAVNDAINQLNINNFSKVLDIGSGIGGPARYIAKKTNAEVFAIEIQKDLNDIAVHITNNYEVRKNISHTQADFLKYDFKNIKFDKVVSWLALYHMSQRNNLLNKINNLLMPNGYFYAEDFFLIKSIGNDKMNNIAELFHANHLVEYEKYISELESNNFKVINIEIMTENWTTYTHNRLMLFKKNIKNNLKIHSQDTVDNVLKFYSLAHELLASNILGGLKYTVKKK